MITPEIQIGSYEIEYSYSRSSGPGGQNVNKVNSKATLRWNLIQSASISTEMRYRLLAKLQGQLTLDGDLLISSDRYRDQIRNREDCFEKFKDVLAQASERPKIRRKTKPSFSSKKRLEKAKSAHSQKKSLRKPTRDY